MTSDVPDVRSAPQRHTVAVAVVLAVVTGAAAIVLAIWGPSSVAEAAPGASAPAVEAVARQQAMTFLALGALFAGAVALGAYAITDSMRRRLRPVLDGAAAHARGDLEHSIDAAGDDEIGELATSINATATRLRQNLGRLQESERRLSGLIESMGEGFVMADVDDRVMFVNQRFAELLRRQPAAIVGRYVEELLVPESCERYRAELSRRVEGRASQYEATWHVYGGRHPRTIVSGMPMFDQGGASCGSFAIVTDVTDRTQAQEELARTEKLRALGEMAGGVAHDFNNLLTVVLGNAQLSLMDELPDDVRRTMRAIERSAIEGTERVRRITEFTKSRELATNAVDVDPNLVIGDAVAAARRRQGEAARERGVEYVVDVRRASRRFVRGDAEQLLDALVNIIDNAFEAMPDGGSLIVESFDRGEDSVGMRIEDDGVGMDEFVRQKAFDPFFTTKDPGQCAGLGLSIAFGIVRAHGGRIDVKSSPGHGSTFTIVLPARAPEAEPRALDRPGVPAPPKPRVLLVGVDAKGNEGIQRGLRELGVYVATVASPQAALAILADGGIFNTLVVEHDLDKSSGWAIARDARLIREDLRIVLVVAPGRAIDETQSRNVGIDRVLARPFDARDLHALVFSLLVTPPERRIGTEAVGAPKPSGAEPTTQSVTQEIWGSSTGAETQAEASDSSTR